LEQSHISICVCASQKKSLISTQITKNIAKPITNNDKMGLTLEQCHILICVCDSQKILLISSQITKNRQTRHKPSQITNFVGHLLSSNKASQTVTNTNTNITDNCSNNFRAVLGSPLPLAFDIGARSALGTELSTFFEKKYYHKKKYLTKNRDHHLKERDEIFSAVYRLPK
jgi:hypothetical protein